MTSFSLPRRFVLLFGIFLLVSPLPVTQAGQTEIQGPSGGQFGVNVTVLPNGNIVVVDPYYDFGIWTDTGAVYLYDGANPQGPPLAVVLGIDDYEHIGSGGITVLSNGNFVILSPDHDEGQVDTGAVTWCSGSANAGTNFVTGASSTVGLTSGDMAGTKVVALQNGHYVVLSPGFDNSTAGAVDAGAATWINGTFGQGLAISSTNSLVGTSAGDAVGQTLTELPDGNYVVGSRKWNGTQGAATWCSGTAATVADVSTSNSLVGSTAGDTVGDIIVPLTNGHYVVSSPNWTNPSPAATHAGAVTWCNGNGSTVGPVTQANSLIGDTPNTLIGSSGVVALPNGHYVVCSPGWDHPSPATTDVGAVTWCDGTTGRIGTVSAANSLIGSTTGDQVGRSETGRPGAIALTNSNYVVRSPDWDNPASALADVGAATWCPGSTGRVGTVSAANSMNGGTAGDNVGSAGITALANGNYVVCSPSWDHPASAVADVGAVTWGNGTVGFAGVVSAANSLTGSTANDRVGFLGATALTNGHYVVNSSRWTLPSPLTAEAGAVTWGNGTTGITGPVSAANSLVGSTANDTIGSGGVVALTNGNYLVGSPVWDQTTPAVIDAGAVTWGLGTTGVKGSISAANSLLGSTANDQVGAAMIALANGNYVVRTAGWDRDADTDAGAVTLGNGATGTFGTITVENSVLGAVAGGGAPLAPGYDPAREKLLVGQPAASVVTIRTSPTDSVVLGGSYFTAKEEDGVISIPITRLGGTEGSLSVTLSTSSKGGTATGGDGSSGDYTTLTNLQVDFAPGEVTKTVNVTILDDATENEPNEAFTVTLGSVGGVVLGTPSTATVRIIDADTMDVTPPATAPVISTPGANSLTSVYAGATMTVTGTAKDDRGILLVEVQLNGGDWVPATLTSIKGISATWSATLTPQIGTNTVKARARDTRNNPSPESAAHPFRVARPLVVAASGGKVNTTPTSFREDGKSLSITAKPSAGMLFAGWTISDSALAPSGLSTSALDNPTLTLVFREGLQLVANFAPNPYLTAIAGSYHGLTEPSPTLPDRAPLNTNAGEDGTVSTLGTQGLFKATLASTGVFSGKLVIDGAEVSVTGAFDPFGQARFGKTRARTVTLLRKNLPSLTVSLEAALTSPYQITGTVVTQEVPSNVVTAVSTVNAGRAYFDGKNRIPTDYVGAAPGYTKGTFTVILPPRRPFYSVTGSFDANNDYFDADVTNDFVDGDLVRFREVSGGPALPAGIVAGFDYTVINQTGVSFQLDDGNGIVDVTSVADAEAVLDPDHRQTEGFTVQKYPQGYGIGTLTVTKAGLVKLAGKLADGTTLSASGPLTLDDTDANINLHQRPIVSLFAPLYAKKGFVTTKLKFDSTNSECDFQPANDGAVLWLRPAQPTSHFYPDGWPEVIKTNILGARYTPGTTHSSLKLPNGVTLPDPDANGNATLTLSDGHLISPLTKTANVALNDKVTKVPADDSSFTLAIKRSSGAFSGKFNHPDQNGLPFQGILFQKGTSAGGYGFFLTKKPSPITYDGESGGVTLIGQP